MMTKLGASTSLGRNSWILLRLSMAGHRQGPSVPRPDAGGLAILSRKEGAGRRQALFPFLLPGGCYGSRQFRRRFFRRELAVEGARDHVVDRVLHGSRVGMAM